MDGTHLPVEVILYIVHEVYVIGMLIDKFRHLSLIINGIFAPLAKFRSAVHVTKHAESGIRSQPIGIGLDKRLELGQLKSLCALLTEYFAHKLVLGVVDTLIVDCGKRVKFNGEVVIVLLTVLVVKASKFAKTHKHGVQRKC